MLHNIKAAQVIPEPLNIEIFRKKNQTVTQQVFPYALKGTYHVTAG